MLMFGKGKWQYELKSIHTDPLKLLLACAWTTFLAGDRVIFPVLPEWEYVHSMGFSALKEFWLQECLSSFQRKM